MPDGQIYTGNFANWTKFGEGNLTWRNGDIFQGVWTDNQVGNGTITYSDGTVYIGQWLGDKRHGKGEMRYILREYTFYLLPIMAIYYGFW